MIAADYPFLDLFWTMLVFFLWVAWFMLLFRVIGDIFRRARPRQAAAKALWLIFVIVVPFLGVLIYVIAENDGMVERQPRTRAGAPAGNLTGHVRETASPAVVRRRRTSRRPSSCSTAGRSRRRSSTRSSRRRLPKNHGLVQADAYLSPSHVPPGAGAFRSGLRRR